MAALSELLGVSQVTIRKDLDALESMELLVREHGYAAAKNMSDIGNRLAVRYDVKQKLAQAAAELVSDGETVMIESGSSCALLASCLSETKKKLRSLQIPRLLPGLSGNPAAATRRSYCWEENIKRMRKLWLDRW